jgi:MFS family permease
MDTSMAKQHAVNAGGIASGSEAPGRYRWFVASVLSVAYAVAFIDRQVFNLLVDPIKHSFHFSDTRISLLQGSAFVVAYIAMGPIFGRIADRGNRRNLMIFGVVAWCASTMICGMSNGFWTLLLGRVGVGGAEACLLPASMSVLADYFEREKLPRAVSILLLGTFVGGGLALIFGGLLMKALSDGSFSIAFLAREPWQLTFMAVGAPGLLVALLMLAVREPVRLGTTAAERVPLRDVLSFLWLERNFYARFFCGVALLYVGLYALPAWTPAMLMRLYGATPHKVGVEYGIATLISAATGVLSGPWVSRNLSRWFPTSAPIHTALLAGALAAIASFCLINAPSYWSAIAASAIASFSLNLAVPMTGAALQDATPNRMRGVLTAAYAITLMTLGVGISPTVIALLTEHVYGDPARLGASLGWVSGLAAIASLPLLAATARPYCQRVAAMSGATSETRPATNRAR